MYKRNNLDLEALPMRERMRPFVAWGRYRRRTWYRIAEHTIKRFMGRNFDKAFAYYCRRVEQQYQYKFFDYFENFNTCKRHKENYIIDKDKNIQILKDPYHKNNRFPKTVYSDDYKYAWFLKKEYENLLFRFLPNPPKYSWQSQGFYVLEKIDRASNIPERYKDMYEYRLLSGYSTTFEKRDNKYKRFLWEEEDKRRKLERIKQREKKEIEYSFLTKSEKELLKSKD